MHILLLILSNLLRSCVYFDVYLGLTLISYAASVISNGFSLFSFKATFLGILGILMMLSQILRPMEVIKSPGILQIFVVYGRREASVCHNMSEWARMRPAGTMHGTQTAVEVAIQRGIGWDEVCDASMGFYCDTNDELSREVLEYVLHSSWMGYTAGRRLLGWCASKRMAG